MFPNSESLQGGPCGRGIDFVDEELKAPFEYWARTHKFMSTKRSLLHHEPPCNREKKEIRGQKHADDTLRQKLAL